MTQLSDDRIIDAIESSLAIMPEVPGRLTHLHFPGVALRGRLTGISHPFANNVSCAKLEKDVTGQVTLVRDFFWERNLPFSWTIGPRTLPTDLATHLATAEMFLGTQMAGLAYRDISVAFPHQSTARVREIDSTSETDAAQLAQIAADGFGMPLDLCQLFSDSYLQPGEARIRGYLAYSADSEQPESFAASIYLPGVPIVLLSGAATVPEGRGKGLYQALVARRLADAHADGIQTAIIQAVRSTSAPILMKRGFEELCSLETWMGIPPSLRETPTAE